jgi:hypothetical protein
MPPSIIAVDTRNFSHVHHVHARQRRPLLLEATSRSRSEPQRFDEIPAVVETSKAVSTGAHPHIAAVHTLPKAQLTTRPLPSVSKKQSLSVSIHMPIPLVRVDTSSTFHSLDGLSNSYALVRSELRQKLEPRYNALLRHKRNIRKNQQHVVEELNQLKCRLKRMSHTTSPSSKSVRFSHPEVTETHIRPYTPTNEISRLFFQEDELDQFEQDRSRDPGDIVECAFVEEARAISVAYQRRTSVDD